MKRTLESSRYLVLLAIILLIATAAAAFVWGPVSVVNVIAELVRYGGQLPPSPAEFVALVDKFLLAAAMLLFAVGLCELFIGGLNVPARLVIHNLHDLKTRLASVATLVMGVTFLEHLIEGADPPGMLYVGAAIVLVSATLIAFAQFGEKSRGVRAGAHAPVGRPGIPALPSER
jgi:uncharacterized membrane protein YqhA